jgi:nucleotide-binding universal stress UspA family protein
MTSVDHIFVCLDLSEMDDHLINYSLFLGNKLGCRKLTYIHIVKEWDLPDEVEELVDVPGGDLETLIRKELAEKLQDKSSRGLETALVVKRGRSVPEVLQEEAKQHKPDVVMVGNKNLYAGSGYASTRILEEVELPMLLIPETAYLQVNNILLPIDFSKHSRNVIETGTAMAKLLGANKQAVHVVHVPERFFPYIPEKKAMREAYKTAEHSYREFVKKLKLEESLECDFISTGEHGIARRIYNYAIKHQFDLIVVAAKGRNWLNIATIGGVSYRLANLDLHIPLLIVK